MNRDHGGAVWFSLCSLEHVDFGGDPGFSQVGGALIQQQSHDSRLSSWVTEHLAQQALCCRL